jgi:hypothetical protein
MSFLSGSKAIVEIQKSRIKRTFPVLETTVADSDACREAEVRLGSTQEMKG